MRVNVHVCVSMCICWCIVCVCVCACVWGWKESEEAQDFTLKLRKDSQQQILHNTLLLLFATKLCILTSLPSPSRERLRVLFVKILTHGNDGGRDASHDDRRQDQQEETKGS